MVVVYDRSVEQKSKKVSKQRALYFQETKDRSYGWAQPHSSIEPTATPTMNLSRRTHAFPGCSISGNLGCVWTWPFHPAISLHHLHGLSSVPSSAASKTRMNPTPP
jgi:hypothetical protein